MPVTSTSRPVGLARATTSALILALYRPYGRMSSGPSPSSAATSWIGRILAAWAIAMSDGTEATWLCSRQLGGWKTKHARRVRARDGDQLVHRQATHRGEALGDVP